MDLTNPSIESVISHRRWIRHHHPFNHVTADNVFIPSFYQELETAFLDALNSRDSAPNRDDVFRRDMRGYDALGLTFNADVAAPFDFFFTKAWRVLLAGLFDVAASSHVSGGLHHHSVGSADGTVHNDLNPGWFVDRPRADGTIVSDRRLCDYKTGHVPDGRSRAVELVRGVSMLFYLANPSWQPADGGTTGLYERAGDDIAAPAVEIPPLNNSLIAFECTPVSFHGFISNRRHPRNCLVLWVHRPKRDVVERWGARAIVGWQR